MNAYAQDQADKAIPALERSISLTGSDQSRNSYQIRRAYAALSRIEAATGHQDKAEQLASHAEQIHQEMLRGPVSSTLSESTGLIMANSPQKSRPPSGSAPSAGPAAMPTPDQRQLEQQLQATVAKSLNDAGTVLARTHNYAEALSLFRQAAIADPTLSPVLRNLGLAAFHTGAYAEAVAAFTHALEQDANDNLARDYLGRSRALLSEPQPASTAPPE